MYVFERLLYREKANIWTPVKIWHKNKTFFLLAQHFLRFFWNNYTLSLYFMKSRQTHVENVNADYFEMCKNAPQNCTNAFVWDSEQQTKIFFFFKMTKTWNTLEGCFYLSAYGGRQSFFTTNQILMNVLP